MTRCDRLALVVCLGVVLACYFISVVVFESIPHLEDEMAFTWQAKIIRKGLLSIPSPQPNPESFPVPFVLDYQGNRFSKYPIGWPVILAFGEWLGIRAMINPFISGVSF